MGKRSQELEERLLRCLCRPSGRHAVLGGIPRARRGGRSAVPASLAEPAPRPDDLADDQVEGMTVDLDGDQRMLPARAGSGGGSGAGR